MASKVASLIAEIQAQHPGALLKAGGRGRKHLDFSLPDGRSVFVAEIADLHYRDGLGQWQEVDEGLVDDGADGFAKRCDRTRHAFRVGNGGTRRWYPRREVAGEYVDITAIQYWRTTGAGSWRNVAMPAAVWRSQGADWDLANLHASVTNTWRRVKADFVLKDATAPTRLRFAVNFVGLTLGADWRLTSTTDGTVVGSIDPPVAWDANGASVPVSATYVGGYIEWAADTSAAAYPVTVDPTFTDGPGGDVDSAYDTMAYEPNPTTTYATITSLYIGSASGNLASGLLKFDLSSIGAGVTYTSIDLTLTMAGRDWSSNPIAISRILSGNSDWTEAEACHSYRVGTTAWAGSAGCRTSGTDYAVSDLATRTIGEDPDNTEYTTALDATEFENMRAANYGLVIRRTDTNSYIRFQSSDATTTTYRPKLVVVYTAGTTYTWSGAGTLTTAGALTKRNDQPLDGTLTTAGTLLEQINQALSGTLTSAGALARQTNKALTGTLATAGSLAKQGARSLAGSLATAGALAKQTSKSVAGTLTTAGALSVIRAIEISLSGTLATAGSLTRRVDKGLAGTLTSAGSLGRALSLGLSGALVTAGGLTKQVAKGFAGALSSAGSVAVVIVGTLVIRGPVAARLGSMGRRLADMLSGRTAARTNDGKTGVG